MPDLHDRQPFGLRDRNGRILFADETSASLGDTMDRYVEHLDELTRTNHSLSVHRELLRELSEVMYVHRGDVALARHALELDERVTALGPDEPPPGGLRGVVARIRATGAEREAARQRSALTANRDALAGTLPDAQQVADAGLRLDQLRTTIYGQATLMRSRDIARELGSHPGWVTNTLGERPSDPGLQKVWNRTAHDIAARRVDMRITEPDALGLPASQHELLTAISEARVELGLEVPTPAAQQELGLALA